MAEEKISLEQVRHVARLARLEFAPAEERRLQVEMSEMLGYVDKLNELDVSKVQPMAQVIFSPGEGTGAHLELRDDLRVDCDTAAQVFDRAADSEKPFFRVPKVIER